MKFAALAPLVALSLATLLPGCGRDKENIADRAIAAAAPTAEAAVAVAPTPRPGPAPAAFQAEIEALARPFEGDVGVAVKDLRNGWAAAWQGDKFFPQQSAMKIWLAVAVLDAADRAALNLQERVVVRPADLSVFNQPMRPLVLKEGGWDTTWDSLLFWSISKSDNAATDMLMRRVGGGGAVQRVLDAKGLRDVRVGVEERLLQPRISGLEWREEYLDGDLFNRARDRVPDAVRDAALEQYLRSPPDGATPIGTVNALEALAAGRLLSPASTERLLRIMSESRAGAARLKAGLPPSAGTAAEPTGWRLSHKTGTGPDWRNTTAGYNDVGLMVAPDGHAYAVAVYIGRTDRPVRERQVLIADVARAVVAHWQAGRPAAAQTVAANSAAPVEAGRATVPPTAAPPAPAAAP